MGAYLSILSPDFVVPEAPEDDPSGLSTASGTASLNLDLNGPGGPTLSYSIELSGLSLSDSLPRAPLDGDPSIVRAIHLHFGAPGANGGHALNIYGVPREDDADLLVFEGASRLTGIWDDADENFGGDGVYGMGDSVSLTSALDALQAGELYLQVHTLGFRQGELRGQVVAVPEPHLCGTVLMGVVLLLSMFRRVRH
ncbi:CHRD domain-containing protein [Coraliomargarita akajimensis]|uniref:CHRD domain containing protein n=1 Tax=Coraliomargarita akajimensis (strain DSM 45221 / IAM 15411 / JCM 23193 / KCTC 12865 / 04OKA010-24) TaxID=583355 RepID=D5EP09_CORAD|nr:CHRD domain-containing protein [Coraliomargarita akajimensis]ADE53668.1 CHRD domain containing protein [Coraliomargarita akajimensis DSM 45221]